MTFLCIKFSLFFSPGGTASNFFVNILFLVVTHYCYRWYGLFVGPLVPEPAQLVYTLTLCALVSIFFLVITHYCHRQHVQLFGFLTPGPTQLACGLTFCAWVFLPMCVTLPAGLLALVSLSLPSMWTAVGAISSLSISWLLSPFWQRMLSDSISHDSPQGAGWSP